MQAAMGQGACYTPWEVAVLSYETAAGCVFKTSKGLAYCKDDAT